MGAGSCPFGNGSASTSTAPNTAPGRRGDVAAGFEHHRAVAYPASTGPSSSPVPREAAAHRVRGILPRRRSPARPRRTLAETASQNGTSPFVETVTRPIRELLQLQPRSAPPRTSPASKGRRAHRRGVRPSRRVARASERASSRSRFGARSCGGVRGHGGRPRGSRSARGAELVERGAADVVEALARGLALGEVLAAELFDERADLGQARRCRLGNRERGERARTAIADRQRIGDHRG